MISSHAEISSAYSELVEEHEQLKAKYHRLRDAALFVCDELEEDFDIVEGDGQLVPNKAMRLASELNEAMYLYGPGGF